MGLLLVNTPQVGISGKLNFSGEDKFLSLKFNLLTPVVMFSFIEPPSREMHQTGVRATADIHIPRKQADCLVLLLFLLYLSKILC